MSRPTTTTSKLWPVLLALGFVGSLGGLACSVDELEQSEFDESDDSTYVERDVQIDGYDCSLFQNYPAPPPYNAPGPHCNQNNPSPPNPGCPAGVGDQCEIPDSGWEGPYNIYKDNCHDAASCGVDAGDCANVTTGILSCGGNTSGTGGHTVNYSVFPGKGANLGKWIVCLSEPQKNDPDADKCCWVQNTQTPQTAAGQPGHACYDYQCHPQNEDHGGTALPSGQCWPTPSSDPPCGTTWNNAALVCCQNYAKRWDHSLPKWCSQNGYNTQVQFRCEAYAECVQSAGATLPEPPTDTDTDTDTAEDGTDGGGGTGGAQTDSGSTGEVGSSSGIGSSSSDGGSSDGAQGTSTGDVIHISEGGWSDSGLW